jgi:hypothetical protein
VGVLQIGGGAHDAGAAGLGGEHHALGHDVRRCVLVAREHRDGERPRLVEAGAVGALAEPFDAGLQHVDAPVRVHGGVAHPERPEHPGRLVDGGRDVVELQIEEHLVAEIGEGADDLGSGGAVELEPDLGDPEVGPQLPADAQREHQVVDVEGEGQPPADLGRYVGGRGVSHGLLR